MYKGKTRGKRQIQTQMARIPKHECPTCQSIENCSGWLVLKKKVQSEMVLDQKINASTSEWWELYYYPQKTSKKRKICPKTDSNGWYPKHKCSNKNVFLQKRNKNKLKKETHTRQQQQNQTIATSWWKPCQGKKNNAATHWHTATHCYTLLHTTTRCNTLQHTATHCNTLQHTAPHFQNKALLDLCRQPNIRLLSFGNLNELNLFWQPTVTLF